MKHFFISLVMLMQLSGISAQKKDPLRIGIAGLTHTHVHWVFNSAKKENIEIVGIAEADSLLAEKYALQYGFPKEKIYATLDEMIDQVKPEVVTAFNSIAGHLNVVETCAPLGIHVMVEKPLAVDLLQARKMEALAKKYKIQLLTNYETTWYSSVHQLKKDINDSMIGLVRKMVIHDGHKGPKEIGVNIEFLEWLTDPKENGAGALMDFGCYGANLSTFIMNGERPVSVTAIVQQIKPDIYPLVDDEATIILTYPSAQTIIQASWNWPFSRKDMEVYGTKGYIKAIDGNTMAVRLGEDTKDAIIDLKALQAPFHDPFLFFRALLRNKIHPPQHHLSSLEINMIVMEILDAALQSARENRTIFLN